MRTVTKEKKDGRSYSYDEVDTVEEAVHCLGEKKVVAFVNYCLGVKAAKKADLVGLNKEQRDALKDPEIRAAVEKAIEERKKTVM